jgi:hypothetical protein
LKRYEDLNYTTLLVLFLIAGGLSLISVATLAVALWEDPALLQRDRWPEWVQGAGLGCMVGCWGLVCFSWELYSRPRMVVSEGDAV